ncbi:MAG: hypothetical protein M1479_07900 [Actinobacteria bacterium]|nr:hypothetical protein [Actinomycetota bacterium]
MVENIQSIYFKWFGVAGIELKINNCILLVDPYFTRVPFYKMWVGKVIPDSIDPIDSYDILRILTTLNQIDFDTISLTFLKQALPYSSKNRDKIVSYLIENGFLIPRDRTSFSKGKKYQIGLREVVAVEAKLSNWKRGLYQAYRYKEYASKSYLALYLDYLGIYEFKRDRPPPKRLSVADSFDDYKCDDYTDCDYVDF